MVQFCPRRNRFEPDLAYMNTPIDVEEDNQWKHDSEFVKLSKACMAHVLYLIFREKLIDNGLRNVIGLKVMLTDIDNVNYAESHKRVHHILKNT